MIDFYKKSALFSHQNDLISETFGTQKPAEFVQSTAILKLSIFCDSLEQNRGYFMHVSVSISKFVGLFS